MICQRLPIISFCWSSFWNQWIWIGMKLQEGYVTSHHIYYYLRKLFIVFCLFVCLYVCVCMCVCVWLLEYMNSVCSQTCKRSFVVTLYISKWSETKPWHWMIDWDTTKDFFCCFNFLNYAGNHFFAFSIIINRTWVKRETTSTKAILNIESNPINNIYKLA